MIDCLGKIRAVFVPCLIYNYLVGTKQADWVDWTGSASDFAIPGSVTSSLDCSWPAGAGGTSWFGVWAGSTAVGTQVSMSGHSRCYLSW